MHAGSVPNKLVSKDGEVSHDVALKSAALSTTTGAGSSESGKLVSAGTNQQFPSEEKCLQHQLPVSNSDYQDPWCITSEQRQYYTKQFASMQSDTSGKIDGALLSVSWSIQIAIIFNLAKKYAVNSFGKVHWF